jgi:hypothetical protein
MNAASGPMNVPVWLVWLVVAAAALGLFLLAATLPG